MLRYESCGFEALIEAATNLGVEPKDHLISVVGDSIRVARKHRSREWIVLIGRIGEAACWGFSDEEADKLLVGTPWEGNAKWIYGQVVGDWHDTRAFLCGKLQIPLGSRNYSLWTPELAIEYTLEKRSSKSN